MTQPPKYFNNNDTEIDPSTMIPTNDIRENNKWMRLHFMLESVKTILAFFIVLIMLWMIWYVIDNNVLGNILYELRR